MMDKSEKRILEKIIQTGILTAGELVQLVNMFMVAHKHETKKTKRK